MVGQLPHPGQQHQRGSSMVEVLVTFVIVAVGLLGLAGLQVRLQSAQLESYQRSQALLLLGDMANRMAINRNHVADYVTTAANPLGAGMTCPANAATLAQRDAGEWCNALQGAAETSAAGGSKVGAMIGGRGCVEALGSDYLLTVVWQGVVPVSAPPESLACGKDGYNASSGACRNDLCRRAVTTVLRIAPS
jgi:type IV pilus assembly protein PilV